MNIDEYLNNLQADLDNQLSQFGLGCSQTSGQQPEEGFSDFKFCPECGTKVDADARFCPNCGTRLDSLEEEPEQVEENSFYENSDDEQIGVIFTDTHKLSEKYGCSQDEVMTVIESFREQSREHGMEWYFLDAKEYVEDTDEPFWLDYNEAISDFMQEYELPRCVKVPVFIIGGHDVIPIPMMEDIRALYYTAQAEVCKAFHKIVKKGFPGDDSYLIDRFEESYKEITFSHLDCSLDQIHYTINDLDNAIYEIDMFDPMTFFDVERKLAPIIKRSPKKGEDK
jgi:hypothetical protein